MTTFLEIMHIAPIGFIALLLGVSLLHNSINRNYINFGVLLCAITGIGAGSIFHHHHHAEAFDPCFVYYSAIVYALARLIYSATHRIAR